MYAEDKEPVILEELDWNQLIKLQESSGDGPLIKIPFSLDTPYLKKDFNLDLIIWNLSSKNMEITKRTVNYVLKNFNKLFETGWTMLYYHLCATEVYPDVAEHTLEEFYKEQIDFEYPYYSIQLEINSTHLEDGMARYCFVVPTTCDCSRWMISDDNMRAYMVNNKCCQFNTNNDDMQMLEDNNLEYLYGKDEWYADIYKKMESKGFQYAEPFRP